MVVIIDADYNVKNQGHVVGILVENIYSKKEIGYVTAVVNNVGDYIAGKFYKRELGCIDAILKRLSLETIDTIIVDGYADFGTEECSLGNYVYNNYHIPVIGIAKKRYANCKIDNTEVYRGISKRPLYVTSKGLTLEKAKYYVKKMYGKYRLPYLTKLADSICRDWRK